MSFHDLKNFSIIYYFVIPEESPDRVDEKIDNATAKKSTSRKKRRSKLSTKKSVGEIENSPRFFAEEDPDFFPDPNLRLALQSLRVIRSLKNNYKTI